MKLVIPLLACMVKLAHAEPDFSMSESANEDTLVELPVRDLALEEIALEIDGKRIAPWKVARWAAQGAPINLTVLVQGTEAWMGNDDIVQDDDPSRRPGAFLTLGEQLGNLEPRNWVPKASHIRIATYNLQRRWLEDRPFSAGLGSQLDYFGRSGTPLSDAIEGVAKQMIDEVPVRRRIIVVIGDGCDDADDKRRAELRSWLADHHVELYALVYKAKESCPNTHVAKLTARAQTHTTVEAIPNALRGILESLDDRMYAWFDRDQLPWDGELHEHYVMAGGQRLGPIYRELPDRRSSGWPSWWLAAATGAVVLILLVIGRAIVRRPGDGVAR